MRVEADVAREHTGTIDGKPVRVIDEVENARIVESGPAEEVEFNEQSGSIETDEEDPDGDH